jgi:hypothetical protein
MTAGELSQWKDARSALAKAFPQLYELEPDGPLALDLGPDGGCSRSSRRANCSASTASRWRTS